MAALKHLLSILIFLLIHLATASPQAQDFGYPAAEPDVELERRNGHDATAASSSNLGLTSITIRATPFVTILDTQLVTSYLPEAEDLLSTAVSNLPLERRNGPVTCSTESRSSSQVIRPLTIITVLANPIPVTAQRQLVTSYDAVMTICPLDAQPLVNQIKHFRSTHTTWSSSGLFSPKSTVRSNAALPLKSSDVSACSISDTPTLTPICHTTLSPLAAPPIPITACEQNVTISSQFGLTLVAASPIPGYRGTGLPPTNASSTIATLTTYYVVPWDDVHAGVLPTAGVAVEVCSSGGTACKTQREMWGTRESEYITVGTKTVGVHATVVGPARLILDPDIDPITISGTTLSSIDFAAVITTTQTTISAAVTKAIADAPVTNDAGVVAPTDEGDEGQLVRVSSTITRTVTAVSASSTATSTL